MKKYYIFAFVFSLCITLGTCLFVYKTIRNQVETDIRAEIISTYTEPETTPSAESKMDYELIDYVPVVDPIVPEDEVNTIYFSPEHVETTDLSMSDIELIALCTMGEAEGEPEMGKRLVIDVILNRIDHPAFPNTAYGVVWQANQFSCMWSDRLSRCYVDDEIVDLVIDECMHRTNTEVVFFMAGDYLPYGTPMFQVGNHYFSSY